ncbi:MAG: gliding motility-associated ABC transporter substrate-binding protein GldG [Cytophagaceae bacterium]|jgi:gliding-associated putative ABC transporter substrate-binding component GldG|nr:gliding motility-associated ABC transporter substrate-binding protein GldG [Cytophagaceae bacterium]
MKKKTADIVEFSLWLGIILALNVIAAHYFFRLDLTEDKRYSLSEAGKDLLGKVNEQLIIKVYLSGDLDPAYERLRKSVEEKLKEFQVYANGKVELEFIDPNADDNPALKQRLYQELHARGIRKDVYLSQRNGKKQEITVFPGAVLSYREKDQAVNFLKGSSIIPKEQQLNQSVETLEFELLSALRKLVASEIQTIGIVEGHGELSKEEMQDLSNALNENYSTERITLSANQDLSRFQALLIANPTRAWSEQDKFLVDQYLMQGGNLMYCIDGTEVRKDSLRNGITFSLIRNLQLDDQLFRYGVRINQDQIQDLSCAVSKVETGLHGEVQLLDFPYYPILFNFSTHPMVKNLDAVLGRFVSSMDTVKADGIVKTPLLFTSANARCMTAPSEINLNALKKDLNKETLNRSLIPVAYCLEGTFTSLYKSRPLPIPGKSKLDKGIKPGKIIVCGDGDIPRNDFDKSRNAAAPLGYHADMRYLFSNKEFILNGMDYLLNENIIRARSKEIKLRPLDKIRISEERSAWQVLNVLAPAILIALMGLAWHILRKKKFENAR